MDIRIESDGTITKVFVDGKQIPKATMADFIFHAEPGEVYCSVERVKTDDNGVPLISKKNWSIEKETEVLINTLKDDLVIGKDQINKLNQRLLTDNRFDDLKRSISDPDFQKQLLKEYRLEK